MSRSPLLASACVLSLFAACGQSAPSAPERTSAALSEPKVWITAPDDMLELVARILGGAPEVRRGETHEAVALEVPERILPELSELAHEERGRCGGYMQHDSEQAALESLGKRSSHQALYFAPNYTIDNGDTVKALFPELKEANVLATIKKLSSYRNRFHTTMTGTQASEWIRDTWKALAKDRPDISVELIDHNRSPQPSIGMTMRGAKLPDEVVVLGGHMDSTAGRGGDVLAPGADDNASGIAVLTEIARTAIALGYKPDRTVVFYGYAAEEVGLVGSAEIAAEAKRMQRNVVGVMQLDMTNFTVASKPYITLIRDNTDATLNAFSIKLIETYLDMPWMYHDCGYGCSDHASWTQNGFPSTFPHEAKMNEGNKKIHTPDDTLALSRDSVGHSMHFARFGAAFLAEMAKGTLAKSAECSASKPCAAGERCEMGMCVAEPAPGTDKPVDADLCARVRCAAGTRCEDGKCVPEDDDAECSASKPCAAGERCESGVCRAAGKSDGGASVRRDAGAPSARDEDDDDARGEDDGVPASDDDSADEDEDEDEKSDELEQDESSVKGVRESGCSAGGAGSGTWGALMALLALRRRRRSC